MARKGEMIEVLQGGGVSSGARIQGGRDLRRGKDGGRGNPGSGYSSCRERPAAVAATFTTNRVVSPSVTLSRERAARGAARAVVANSGCANCCVGEQGMLDVMEMTALAARHVSVDEEEVLAASTGMNGVELPDGADTAGHRQRAPSA